MIYILILIGFCLLIYGGNMLVDGSVAVAQRMRVSPLLIGVVLIGFGTSTPELMTSLIAAYKNSEGIAVGNVIGSNIANILLVLGVGICIRMVSVRKDSFKRDGLFLIISTLVLLFSLLWGVIGRLFGLIMCATLGYYVYYSYKTEKNHQAQEENLNSFVGGDYKHLLFSVAKVVGGIILTIAGAHVLVTNSIVLAERWKVSETVIGLTIIAVGTSLPELVTSIIASLKKQGELVLGNVIGSNIYNALFVLGLTAVFVPVKVPKDVMIDLSVMIGVTGLLLGLGWRGSLSRKVGFIFVGLYILYVIYSYGA